MESNSRPKYIQVESTLEFSRLVCALERMPRVSFLHEHKGSKVLSVQIDLLKEKPVIYYTPNSDVGHFLAINSGGVIIFPTDTVYGIGCSQFKNKAIEPLLYKMAYADSSPRSARIFSISSHASGSKCLAHVTISPAMHPAPLLLLYVPCVIHALAPL